MRNRPDRTFRRIERPYSADDVLRLRGSVPIEHSLARRGALKLWELLKRDEPVRALGAVTGNQAMQMVRAGLEAIYLSGWQAAADANTAGRCIPTSRSIRPTPGPNSPARSTARCSADQIEHAEGGAQRDWLRRSSPMPRPGSAGLSIASRS